MKIACHPPALHTPIPRTAAAPPSAEASGPADCAELSASCTAGPAAAPSAASLAASAHSLAGQVGSSAGGPAMGPSLRLVLVGGPGSGKGTQASIMAKIFEVPHLSTGQILREEIKNNTELGQQAAPYVQAGQLVPDELILGMVQQRVENLPGFILDGFPRSLPQAEKLGDMLREPLSAVALLDVSDEVLFERLKARGREDDTDEAIRQRIQIFHEQTGPAVEHYRQQGLLLTVPGEGSIGEVAGELARGICNRLYLPH